MATIADIEGIGPVYAAKLNEAGVKTTEGLLKKAAAKKGRVKLAAESGISEKLILRWVNHADLFRIHGVAGQHAELLEAAGVDSVPELAQRKPENLTQALEDSNAKLKKVRDVPTLKEVKAWVAEAKTLERVVTH